MRTLLSVLILIVLLVPFALRRAVVGTSKLGASVSAGARLVVVTPHNQDIRREFGRAFSEWHLQTYGRPVTIDYRTPGGTTDIYRLLKSTYAPYRDAAGKLRDSVPAFLDVVWGGGDFFFAHDLAGDLGVLQPIRIEPALLQASFPQPALAGVKLYDPSLSPAGTPAPLWVGVCLSSFGIVYNPDVYQSLGLPAPRVWADLTNEKLAGFIALADPAHSGSAAVAYMMVLQRAMADAEADLFAARPDIKALPKAQRTKNEAYQASIAAGWKRGMGQLVLIAANAIYFSDSSEQVPTDVSRGEAAAGMAIDFYARVTEETVGPARARFVSPAAATAITPDPVAILRGVTGERRELAEHFVQFLLTARGQRLWILKPGQPDGPADRSLRRPPIRRDVYADRTGWADDVNPFVEAGGFNQRGEWMALFADNRLIWAAAWIDSRDALTDAYRKCRGISDPGRRAALLAELADLPISLGDVSRMAADRAVVEKQQGSADEWRARRRIEWATRFRGHYRDVAAGAGL